MVRFLYASRENHHGKVSSRVTAWFCITKFGASVRKFRMEDALRMHQQQTKRFSSAGHCLSTGTL